MRKNLLNAYHVSNTVLGCGNTRMKTKTTTKILPILGKRESQ